MRVFMLRIASHWSDGQIMSFKGLKSSVCWDILIEIDLGALSMV